MSHFHQLSAFYYHESSDDDDSFTVMFMSWCVLACASARSGMVVAVQRLRSQFSLRCRATLPVLNFATLGGLHTARSAVDNAQTMNARFIIVIIIIIIMQDNRSRTVEPVGVQRFEYKWAGVWEWGWKHKSMRRKKLQRFVSRAHFRPIHSAANQIF